MRNRITGLVLCICILISCSVYGAVNTAAADTSAKTTSTDYGLPKNIQDGNILQCFNWKYSDIKAELKSIAEAGFTAVQTSPAQQPDTNGKWYWLYQPIGFYIGSSNLGGRNELQSLCTEAKKYGIKVIVDIVANHLTGDHGKIQSDLKDSRYWHNKGKCTNWKDRTQLTQCDIGDYADLKTEDSYVQGVVKKYLNDLKSIGVSGFRFDAAKHIATPAEGDNFFKMVKDVGLWAYGEILDSPGGKEADVLKEYTKYVSVNDCNYSGELTGGMRDKKVAANAGHWKLKGVDGAKLIYWGESHDTYSNDPNDGGWTKNLDQNIIDRSYAILACRSDAQGLYLSRPGSKNREDIYAGNKGSTHFKSKEVAAVNHFKNALVGRRESYTTGDGCDVVCRDGGAVIATANGSGGKKTVPNADGLVRAGTYTDLVSGNKFTVTSTTISGTVGSTGIAVFYNEEPAGPSAYATASTSYNTETMKVTLNFENATSGQYSIDGGEFTEFKNGQVITIGKGADYDTVTKVSVKATDGKEWSSVATFSYTKEDPNKKQKVYFDNSTYKWSKVYAYIYSGTESNAKWPGQAMTKDSATGYYVLEVPEDFSTGSIIFTETEKEESTTRYPAHKEPGLQLEGKTKIFKAGNVFEVYTPVRPTEATTQPTTEADTTTPTTEPQKNLLFGDTDLNNSVNIKDATLIQKHAALIEILSGDSLKVSDVDNNGSVNVKDATCIQKYIAKMSDYGNTGKVCN
jgi:alpha-amylase